jgi:hypothetical protein
LKKANLTGQLDRKVGFWVGRNLNLTALNSHSIKIRVENVIRGAYKLPNVVLINQKNNAIN